MVRYVKEVVRENVRTFAEECGERRRQRKASLVALAVEDVARVPVAGELPRDVLDDVVLVVGGAAEELSKGVVDDVNRGRSEDPGVVKGVGYDRERTKTSARRKR